MDEYKKRLDQRSKSWKEADDRAARFGNLRLLIVVAALAAGWNSMWWAVGVCAALFIVVGFRIQALNDQLERFKRAIAYYEQAIDRVQGNWAGRGTTGEAHVPAEHLFANDLDLFGRASLFELLCQARTRLGESTLAGWLLAPADLNTIAARQEAVRELSPKLDLREDLAVIGAGNPRQLRATLLADWGEAAFTKLAEASRPLYRFL
ncbi:MAG: DNA mismatch repair protein MutS, partial [Acidobacteria bacterium]|nr:DNA mismatch repair protein MutS [Acidobacteriota bacterium]